LEKYEKGAKKMNLENWAKEEVELYQNKTGKTINGVIEIITVFGNQGHSGFSAGYALSFINRAIEKGYEIVEDQLIRILSCDEDEDEMQQVITNDIIEILTLFKKYNLGKEEAHLISRLMAWKPINPLTGEDDEWSPVPEWDKDRKTQQNKRCSAVFRDNYDNSTAHYIDGKVFSDDGGKSWWSGKGSSIKVTFPFDIPDKPERIILEDGALS
jgi:hypothetical protein